MAESCPVTTTIHNLPYEILDTIFGYLGLCDIGRCMMVSKQWNSIGREVKIKEITFKYDSVFNEWKTYKPFDQNMVLHSRYLTRPLPLNTTFIRRLAIDLGEHENFSLDVLNKFVHLQHLELRNFNLQSQQGITFLILPSLKILYCCVVKCILVFNTPALTTLCMSNSHKVWFKNSPRLKLLEFDSSFLFDPFPSYNRVKSVEVLRLHYNQNFDFIVDVLNNVKEVNEIRCEYNRMANSIDRLYFEQSVAMILEGRRTLKKMNVKICIFDVMLEDGKAFDEYGPIQKKIYRFLEQRSTDIWRIP